MDEIHDLKLLQFTRAVIETYGSFKVNKAEYLLMKKGISNLDDPNIILSDDLIIDTINRFKILDHAQDILNISNEDAKPGNMLITDDGIKVIDISPTSETRGFQVGSANRENLAFSLLDKPLMGRYRRGTRPLEKYYKERNDSYEREEIASDAYMDLWLKIACEEQNLMDCDSIDNFNDLFSKFNHTHLSNLASKLDDDHLSSIKGSKYSSGNSSDPLNGLKYPQLIEEDLIDWSSYFNLQAEIGKEYCYNLHYNYKNIKESERYLSNDFIEFNQHCEEYEFIRTRNNINYTFKGYKFKTEFNNENDPEFHRIVKSHFEPNVKEMAFTSLARFFYKPNQVFHKIIETELATNDLLRSAFHEFIGY